MIVKLCNADQLPAEGALKAFSGAGQEICVARLEHQPGGIFAFANRCPHQQAPLSAGALAGCMVVCPYHAWSFDVTTGEPATPGDPPLVTYEIRRYADEVFIRLPEPE